ncbi:MAG: cysteine--tRNA ligase [Chlamydiia bacterium]|nr:cysteine--tRNA ligase [Chlamydiia bacterium]
MLKIYNTETRKKEAITLAEGEKLLKMYTCGPTIYNYAHIGNFRTYVFEDLLRRTLKYFAFPLKQVMNLTDVEDKTILAAKEKGIPLREHTKIYKEAFFEDLKTLGIEPAEIYSPATDYVPEMIAMIETLIKKGYAYQGQDQGVYYSIKHFPSYGRLSHLKLDDLQTGASERLTHDEYDKESASDFVLWKPYDPERDGEVFWDSPFGKGRPGWHVECSAMATKLLGETIDIHVGGVDNIFPHHENEIAQSEGCTGKHFVRHWIHAEHLIVDGKKMSKSLGNFFTLRDLLAKGYTGPEVRYLLLSTHYRTQLNFTLEGLEAARQTLNRLRDFIRRLRSAKAQEGGSVASYLEKAQKTFKEALSDDLNISSALAALFDLIRPINALIDASKMTAQEGQNVLFFLKDLDCVLGVLPLEEEVVEIPPEVQKAFEKREVARKAKNWEEADKERDFIHAKGYQIEDSPEGSRVIKSTG